MKHAFACMVALVMWPALTQAGDIQMDQEKSAVLNALHAMTDNFQNGEIEAVMQSYEPAATVLFQPGTEVSDLKQIAANFAAFSAMNPRFSYAGHEVTVQGDIATHIAPWTMMASGPDGQPLEQSGLSVSVWRRQLDGSWKMVIDNPNAAHLLMQ
jgi:ketosteroid isomerase-like protein